MRIVPLSLAVLMIASCSEEQARSRRGAFAFHYGRPLNDDSLAWYSRFDVLVTHDPLPRDQVDRLHAAGTRLVLYEWAVAFYDSRASDWDRSLLANRHANLLNETPLFGAVGSETSGAWYFDPASPEHETGRTTELVRRIENAGYDGIFFDTTTVESLHPAARKEYDQRHPGIPYDLAFSRFLSQLRKKLPRGIIFTNQGYRSARYYLPFADWDLTESAITRPHNGTYQLRPWNDPADPWNSSYHLMRTVIEPIADRYPNVRFGHLNYMDGESPETIRVVVALAQLFGGDGYVATQSGHDEADPIYFRDAGKPVSARVDCANGQASYRFFEHGMIAVTAAKEAITIDHLPRRGLRNHLTRELICADSITLPPAPAGPRAHFFDSTSDCSSR